MTRCSRFERNDELKELISIVSNDRRPRRALWHFSSPSQPREDVAMDLYELSSYSSGNCVKVRQAFSVFDETYENLKVLVIKSTQKNTCHSKTLHLVRL